MSLDIVWGTKKGNRLIVRLKLHIGNGLEFGGIRLELTSSENERDVIVQ